MGGSARFLEGTAGKIGLNVEKWSFSQGLSKEFFQVVPDTHYFTPFPTKLTPLKAQEAPKS